MPEPIAVAIIGGSGFYELLDDADEIELDTPYGAPSAPIVVGDVAGRRVGFLPRHGRHHELPPHRINYRANLWALSELGATDVILPCAAGSLRAEVKPGHFVIADQLVDRTRNRSDTFFDGPQTTHVSFAEPYDAELRTIAIDTARALDIVVHDHGTVVVIEGPRFSTRAESQFYSTMGWDVINMTQCPEVALARELQMAAVNVSLITDYDAGLDDDPQVPAVTKDEVVKVFNANNAKLRELLFAMVPRLPLSPDRPALHALEGAQF